jgi:hypothetical protein
MGRRAKLSIVVTLLALGVSAAMVRDCDCEERMKRLEQDQIRLRTWVNALHVYVLENL